MSRFAPSLCSIVRPFSYLVRVICPGTDNKMEVFLMVKRKNLTMFLDGKTTTTVLEVKKMIQGITKKLPEDQRLLFFHENREMEDNKTLADYGLNSQVAKAQTPALLAVTYKNEEGQFEEVDFTPLSQPPDLPEAMKQPESSIMSQHKTQLKGEKL